MTKRNLSKIKSPESQVFMWRSGLNMAGVQGLEPWAPGFGDQCSTN